MVDEDHGIAADHEDAIAIDWHYKTNLEEATLEDMPQSQEINGAPEVSCFLVLMCDNVQIQENFSASRRTKCNNMLDSKVNLESFCKL